MLQEVLINLENMFGVSLAMSLAASFLAGLVASLSPCIYPLLPITLGVIGAVASNSRSRGFLISFIFVLGIAVCYSFLGAIASLMGLLVASIIINPVTYLALVIVFILLGFSQLGLLKLRMPFLSLSASSGNSKGLWAVFTLGVVSALAMVPCNFPVLFSILNLIGLKKNVIFGIIALFVFSMGYGMILIVLGTFTSLIGKLPKQSRWILITKKITAFILLAVGLYFAYKFIDLIR